MHRESAEYEIYIWIKDDVPNWFIASGPFIVLTDSRHVVLDKTFDFGDDPRFRKEWPEVLQALLQNQKWIPGMGSEIENISASPVGQSNL